MNSNDCQLSDFSPDTIKKAMLLWEAAQSLCDSLWDTFEEDFISLDEMRENRNQQIISDNEDPFPF
jgi:hypothetical protein